MQGPIGIFDSGYGGLTVLKSIQEKLSDYDYLYLGDNARAPYGTRSFDVVYQYTLEAVEKLFDMGCPLVILACNTASAKALRSIQQKDLPLMDDSSKRVLGVIRPSTEKVAELTRTNHVGIFATNGTVKSNSYKIEIEKFHPNIKVTQEACPMWVPIVENEEFGTDGSRYFIKQHVDALLKKDRAIDTIILGCTHYPLIKKEIEQFVPANINVIAQGDIVATSLSEYLERHPSMEKRLTKNGRSSFYTTENPDTFSKKASFFLDKEVIAQKLSY